MLLCMPNDNKHSDAVSSALLVSHVHSCGADVNSGLS
jgi:hypothetical protein